MTLGTAVGVVGMFANDELVQQCELAGGGAIFAISVARLFFLKSKGRKRQSWHG